MKEAFKIQRRPSRKFLSTMNYMPSSRTLSDAELAREIAKLESEIDRLDGAPWPGAHLQQAEVLERLLRLRAEAERRHV